jgi:hypothetical protein
MLLCENDSFADNMFDQITKRPDGLPSQLLLTGHHEQPVNPSALEAIEVLQLRHTDSIPIILAV